jgi:hypothetical protein
MIWRRPSMSNRAKTKNRIQIVNWRNHGDDESSCTIGVYSHEDLTDELLDARGKLGLKTDPDWEENDDYENGYYVNDDITIENGQIMEHNGRKFRISIRELT